MRFYLYFLKIFFPLKYARKIGVKFGERCVLSRGVSYGSEPYLIEIGDSFYCSSKIQFINHDGSMHVLRNLYSECVDWDYFGKIVIGDNCFLGYGVIVLPGVVIGDNVVVGAGSLVKGKLVSNSVYAGVPARLICSIDDFHHRKKNLVHPTKGMTAHDKKEYLDINFQ